MEPDVCSIFLYEEYIFFCLEILFDFERKSELGKKIEKIENVCLEFII